MGAKPAQELRVLIVGHDPKLPGGIANYVRCLSGYLTQQPNVVVSFLNENEIKRNANVHHQSIPVKLAAARRMIAAIQSAIDQHRPNVVHLQAAYGYSVTEKAILAWVAKSRGVPAIVHMHGSSFERELETMPASRRAWLSQALSKPNHVVVLSGKLQKLLAEKFPFAGNTAIPTSVEATAQPYPLSTAPLVVGFIGLLNGRKGENDLINAFARIKDTEATLVIAGDGDNKATAEKLAADLGLSARVRFLGNVSGMVKEQFFRDINILCLPSHAENMPAALLEAMSHGRPVIGSRIGAIPEMIDIKNDGWLVDVGDVDAIAQAIDDAASNPDDLRRRGAFAWTKANEKYTWDVNGPRYLALYAQVSGIK